MIRRALKDKELQYITSSDVNSMANGDELDIFLASANSASGYFLGYNGSSATSYVNNTPIFAQENEYAYNLSKGVYGSSDNYEFHIYKTGDAAYLYKEDKSTALTALPTKTTSEVILKNTYNNVTRYLGVDGASITSTTDEIEAKFNEIYHWEMQYQNSSGRFIFYNPKSGRYISFSNNAYSLNTSGTSLYVSYTSGNFRIGGSSATRYYMYMSSDTALGASNRTAQNWTITQVNLLAPTCADEPVEELTAIPTATVNNVLLRNTYNGTIRYLGMTTSNDVTSTTDLDTALADDYYRWNLVYYSSGRFKIQNTQVTSRYIRYSSGYSINTTSSNLYFKYDSSNGFTIAGSSSTTSPYYMYMSETTALARSRNTAYYWDILVDKSSLFAGWVNTKALTIKTATPNTTTGILAGYNTNGILTLGETCGSMSVYLNHGTSVSELNYTKDKTDPDCCWIIYDKNRINTGASAMGGSDIPDTPSGPTEPPSGPKLMVAIADTYDQNPITTSITYPYGNNSKIDLVVTLGGTKTGFILYYEDGTSLSGTTIDWDRLTIVDGNGTVDSDSGSNTHTGNIGFAPAGSSTDYTWATNKGMGVRLESNTDVDGVVHNNSLRFLVSGSASANWPLTYTFIGLRLE